MIITKKHISRRTVLRGMGVTLALPFLDAMVPAETAAREDGRGREDPALVHRAGARRGRQHEDWPREEPVVAGGGGPHVRSRADQPEPARAVSRLPDDRLEHRRAQRRSVPAKRDRRRSLPLERGVPDAGAPEADRGLGRPRRAVARSALRAEVRAGHGDSVDAAVHRERRSGRRLRLRLRVRLHRHDQLGRRRRRRCR